MRQPFRGGGWLARRTENARRSSAESEAPDDLWTQKVVIPYARPGEAVSYVLTFEENIAVLQIESAIV